MKKFITTVFLILFVTLITRADELVADRANHTAKNPAYENLNLNLGEHPFIKNQCAIVNIYPQETPNLDPPNNLIATIIDNDASLEWEAPLASNGEWIYWDNQVNNGTGIGLSNGGTFSVASRWLPSDLAPYNGQTISRISFFANDDPSAIYELKVWTGANAGTQIFYQYISSFVVNQFNEITLSTPIVINASQELWFGYAVTHVAGTLPAGRDEGPAILYNGDMIALDNTTWVSMGTEYNLNYNWNLAAFVENTNAGNPAQAMVKKSDYKMTPGSLATNEGGEFSKKFISSKSKALLGYNIYRDGNLLAYTSNLSYLDEDLIYATYDYYVTAVYDEGESAPSNIATVTGGIITLNPPTNLVASVSNCLIDVSWNPPEIKELLGYNLYRKLNTGSYELVGFTTAVSYQEQGLPCNSYYYIVTAVYDLGESDPTNEALADIPCYPPENLTATVFNNFSVHIASSPPVCGIPLSYNFYRDGNLIGNNSIPEYDDLNLSPGTYIYHSTAVWPEDESTPSNTQTVTINDYVLSPPENLTATIDDCSIDLTWGLPSGATGTFLGYNLYGDGSLLGFMGNNTYQTELEPCATYSFVVTVLYDQGESAPSNEALAEIPCYPPENLTVTIFNNFNVLLECNTPVCGTPLSYNFYRDGNLIGNNSIPDYNDLNLSPGTYNYHSTAVWPEDESTPSNTQPITINDYILSPPENLNANINDCYVELSWDPPSGATGALQGYNLYRDGSLIGFIGGGTYQEEMEPCSSYTFSVTAVYAEGESEPSNNLSVEIPCYPPQNLVATVFDDVNVHLECEAPVCGTPFTYNFYRDGSLIGGNELPEYDHMLLEPGTYEYYATVSYMDEESEPSNLQTVTIEWMLEPPHNLTGSEYVSFGNPIVLNWTAKSTEKELLGFNVYRAYNYNPFELHGFTTDFTFSDYDYDFEGLYTYYITALYDEGESDSTNHHLVDVLEGIEEYLINTIHLYPNPATDIVNVNSKFTIESVKVYSFTGKEVLYEIVNKMDFAIITSGFKSGLYLFQLETNKETIFKRIVVNK